MWKLMTGDGRLASRTAFIPHAVSATFLLFAGLLVVGLAQMGGGASTSPSPRTYVSGCSQSASTSFTTVANKLGYYTPTTATVTRYRTVTKTLTKTRTITKTVTYYRTRTKTVCRTTTVTGPGSTSTVTSNSTTTETTTEQGPTTTVTVTLVPVVSVTDTED